MIMKSIKKYFVKKIKVYQYYRKLDQPYYLLSKFGYDGFDEYPPSYYLRMNPEKLEIWRKKKHCALLKMLNQL